VTLIVTDGLRMGSDSASFQNNLMHPCAEPKIIRAGDGSLIGVTGAAGDATALRAWIRDGMDFDHLPRFSFREPAHDGSILWLWLRAPGEVHMGDCTMTHWPVPVPTAIGFGSPFMLGLLAGGMRLPEALALAIQRTPYLGGAARVERLDGERTAAVLAAEFEPRQVMGVAKWQFD
jgi:hypothetical protein